ncbi:MAG: glutathione synthetase, partial [Bacteroidota bacterium]
MTTTSYRVLVLTDHSKHSKENSIYALLRGMLDTDRCQSVDVASRALVENEGFFYQKDKDALQAVPVSKNFAFDPSGRVFQQGLRLVNVADFDVVFLRLPRPVSDDFLEWLTQIFPTQVFINHPNGILATSTKAFLLQF